MPGPWSSTSTRTPSVQRSRSDAGKQGTGLGLSITKAIFQQHGFRFGVQSAIGMGTTFWFIMNDLPANAAEMAGQE